MQQGDFSLQAEAYRRARPTYPSELIDHLVCIATLQQGDPVADFGAGTGIFTRLLVERGFDVTAIEPNEAMRNQADQTGARWIDGTFERSGLETASQRWGVAAQAFHWADPPRCLPEMRRILQRGCLFTVLWNDRSSTNSEIVNWTESAIRRHVPGFEEAYRANRSGDNSSILESTGDFTFVNHNRVSHTVTMSVERYLDLWRSHNRLNSIAGPVRFTAFFNNLIDHLNQVQPEQIDVRYDCDAWSARRND